MGSGFGRTFGPGGRDRLVPPIRPQPASCADPPSRSCPATAGLACAHECGSGPAPRRRCGTPRRSSNPIVSPNTVSQVPSAAPQDVQQTSARGVKSPRIVKDGDPQVRQLKVVMGWFARQVRGRHAVKFTELNFTIANKS
jgi:hypothetical protein